MFHSELSRNHVHHLLLYRCSVPEGVDAVSLFEGPARGEGSECYFTTMPNPLPVRYCRETIHTWAVGGKVWSELQNRIYENLFALYSLKQIVKSLQPKFTINCISAYILSGSRRSRNEWFRITRIFYAPGQPLY